MSVTKFEPEKIGALAWAVLANNDYRATMQLPVDKLQDHCYQGGADVEDRRIKAFFDRLYMANQMAFYLTDSSDCAEDGSFTVERLQEDDIGTFSIKSARELNSELRHLRYNLISNSGRSFFDKDDSERLDRLIEFTANEVIRQTDPERAVA